MMAFSQSAQASLKKVSDVLAVEELRLLAFKNLSVIFFAATMTDGAKRAAEIASVRFHVTRST